MLHWVRSLLGCVLEGVVVDFCIVFGLAGQKMAAMKIIARHRHAALSLVDDDLLNSSNVEDSPRSETMTVASEIWGDDPDAVNDTPIPEFGELVRDCGWVLSFAIFLFGNLLEMVALSLTSQTNVTLLSNLALLWNALLATLIFKEEFNFFPVNYGWNLFIRWDAFHCFILTVGSLMSVYAAPRDYDESGGDAKEQFARLVRTPFCYFAIFMILSMALASLFLVRNWRNNKTGNLNAALLGGLCAFLGAFALTLSKVTSTLIGLTAGGDNQFGNPEAIVLTIMWVFMILSQLALLNIALGSFEQGIIVPIYEVLGTIATLCSGILYFQTYGDFEKNDTILFSFGVMLMIWGVWLVAHREVHTQQELSEYLHKDLSFVDEFWSLASLSRLNSSPPGRREAVHVSSSAALDSFVGVASNSDYMEEFHYGLLE